MAVRKIKGSWWADFQIRHQRHRYRSPHNTREGAIAFEARLRSELATFGEIRSQVIKNTDSKPIPTLKEFSPRWIEGYVRTNNRPKEQKQKIGVLNSHLIPTFGDLRLDQISTESVERYKGLKQQNELHPKTINNHLIILHKLLVTAKDWAIIQKVPQIKQLKVPDPPFRHLSAKDTEKLLRVIPEQPWRAMVTLAVRTGLRYSELSALKWDDINFEKETLTVRRTLVEGNYGSTKNNRIRHIPLTSAALLSLKELVPAPGHLFLFNDSPILYKTARLKLHKYCEAAGIQVINWHDLRHTFASQLTASGAPIMAVQRFMGHADIKMTMRYSHLEPETLKGVINLLEK